MIKAVRSKRFQTLDPLLLSLEMIASGSAAKIPQPMREWVDRAIADAHGLVGGSKKISEASREGLSLKSLFFEEPAVEELLKEVTNLSDVTREKAASIIPMLG